MSQILVSEEALDSIKAMAQKTLEERDMLLAALKKIVNRNHWMYKYRDAAMEGWIAGRESMRDEAANYAEGEFDFCGDELLVADGIRKIEL